MDDVVPDTTIFFKILLIFKVFLLLLMKPIFLTDFGTVYTSMQPNSIFIYLFIRRSWDFSEKHDTI